MQFFRVLRYKMLEILISAHVYGKGPGPKARRSIMISGFANSIVANLIGGAYLSGLCLELGASAGTINTIIMIITCCSLGQLAAPFILERIQKPKRLLLTVRTLSYVALLIGPPLVAFFMQPGLVPIIIISALLGFSNLISALVGPGMQAWHIANIPPKTQLGFFSLSSTLNMMLVNGALYVGATMTDGLTLLVGRLDALAIMRLLMVGLAVVDIYMLMRLPEKESIPSTETFSPKVMLRCIRENPIYMRTIGVICLWSFLANLPSQFYTAYLLDDLQVSYTFISLVNVFTIFASLILTPIYKRLIQRHSLRSIVAICVGGLFPYGIALFLVTPTTTILYPIGAMYSVICTIGLTLCFAVMPYQNLPEKNQTVLFSLYNAMSVISTLLGVSMSRVLYDVLAGFNLSMGGLLIAPARLLLLVLAFLYLVGTWIVLKLMKKPTPEEIAINRASVPTKVRRKK